MGGSYKERLFWKPDRHMFCAPTVAALEEGTVETMEVVPLEADLYIWGAAYCSCDLETGAGHDLQCIVVAANRKFRRVGVLYPTRSFCCAAGIGRLPLCVAPNGGEGRDTRGGPLDLA